MRNALADCASRPASHSCPRFLHILAFQFRLGPQCSYEILTVMFKVRLSMFGRRDAARKQSSRTRRIGSQRAGAREAQRFLIGQTAERAIMGARQLKYSSSTLPAQRLLRIELPKLDSLDVSFADTRAGNRWRFGIKFRTGPLVFANVITPQNSPSRTPHPSPRAHGAGSRR